MAVLGKRKAPGSSSITQEEADEIFRRHFEAQFEPLDDAPGSKKVEVKRKRKVTAPTTDGDGDSDESADEDNDDTDETEWGGLSDDRISDDDDNDDDDGEEDAPAIEVVDYSASQTSKPIGMSKREIKAFMSSRPPDQTTSRSSPGNQQSAESPPDTLPEDAPSLLSQDLELRRLLSESHLLNLTSSSSAAGDAHYRPFMSGRIRHKTNDLRVQALGSKASILSQEKMPMNVRKGIVAAGAAREAKRRREARENGIILERPAPAKKKRERRRGLAVDRPGMGSFKGAELKLDDKIVKGIESSTDTFGRRSGGKRR